MERLAYVKQGYDAYYAEKFPMMALADFDNQPFVVTTSSTDGDTRYYDGYLLYDANICASIPAAFIEFSKQYEQGDE